VDQTQIPRYVLRFEPLLYIPAFTQNDFHYVHIGPPTQGTSHTGITTQHLEYTTHLSTTSTQEGWAQRQTTITSTQEG